MRFRFFAGRDRPEGGKGRRGLAGLGLCGAALLAVLGLFLPARDALAQYITNAPPRINIRPHITPINPRIRPRIHYNKKFTIQRYDREQSVKIGKTPRKVKRLRRAREIEKTVKSTVKRSIRGIRSVRSDRPDRPDSSGSNNPAVQSARAYIPAPSERRMRPDEVIIEVNGRPGAAEVDALANRHGLERLESQYFALTNTTFFRWRIPGRALIAQRSLGRSVRNVLSALGNDPSVTRAQPNFVTTLQEQRELASLPRGESIDPAQYSVHKLQLLQAHSLARGNNVLVAVIDSGIDVNHPELAGVIAGSFDPLKLEEGAHPHGTGVAGLIAAHARMRGTAPAAQVLAVRAFSVSGKSAESTTFAILKSLEWSVERGARVINMSFAGPFDPAVARALAAAHERGIVLVAAVGNAGPKSPPLFPAADPNVIAVTATDIEDRLFPASNRGRHIAVAAPGVDILAPAPDGRYQVSSGTSFAAPQVSGIAALLIGQQPDLTPDAVRKILIATARDLGPKGHDSLFGAGLTDALGATRAARPQIANSASSVPLPKPQPVRLKQ